MALLDSNNKNHLVGQEEIKMANLAVIDCRLNFKQSSESHR